MKLLANERAACLLMMEQNSGEMVEILKIVGICQIVISSAPVKIAAGQSNNSWSQRYSFLNFSVIPACSHFCFPIEVHSLEISQATISPSSGSAKATLKAL